MAVRWMQAAGIDAFEGEVHLFELAAPGSPAPDELVISVRAAGVGNWDEIVRVGCRVRKSIRSKRPEPSRSRRVGLLGVERLEDVLTPEHRRPIIGELTKLSLELENLLDELQPERRERDEDD